MKTFAVTDPSDLIFFKYRDEALAQIRPCRAGSA